MGLFSFFCSPKVWPALRSSLCADFGFPFQSLLSLQSEAQGVVSRLLAPSVSKNSLAVASHQCTANPLLVAVAVIALAADSGVSGFVFCGGSCCGPQQTADVQSLLVRCLPRSLAGRFAVVLSLSGQDASGLFGAHGGNKPVLLVSVGSGPMEADDTKKAADFVSALSARPLALHLFNQSLG